MNQSPDRIFHMNMDGMAAASEQPKKTEKMPMQKRLKSIPAPREIPEIVPDLEFLQPQPGVAPKFTGSFIRPEQEDNVSTPNEFEYFNFGEGPSAVINPAATYLEGGDFEKKLLQIPTPKCTMSGCIGPLPNDDSFYVDKPTSPGKSCHQTFVQMNGCTNNKGYPIGMVCTICCDCSKNFIREMKKTYGFKIGYIP